MLRTLIFGTIAAIAGKKLYDSGKLDSFKDDLFTRLNINPGGASHATARPATSTGTTGGTTSTAPHYTPTQA
jgi:hypothetical protein